MTIKKVEYHFSDAPGTMSGYLVIAMPDKLAAIYRITQSGVYRAMFSAAVEITGIDEAADVISGYLEGKLSVNTRYNVLDF